MSKIKIRLDNPEIAAIWRAAVEAKKRVAAWPRKRNNDFPSPDDLFDYDPNFLTRKIMKDHGADYMGDIARYANLELD